MAGNWKTSSTGLGRAGTRPNAERRLYDLAADPAEPHNLAAEQPGRVERLAQKLLEEARRTLILPAP